MKNASPQVDAYIAKAAEFARPILRKIRELFHQACPQIQESMKWGMPHFERQGLVAGMSAFKQHCSFGFWKGSLLKDTRQLFQGVGDTPMTALKLTDVSQLPQDMVLIEYILEAVALNEQGVKTPTKKKSAANQDLEIPDYFLAALKKNKKALAAFEAFSFSHKKEYIDWITEAKQDATRTKRLATTIEWLAQGKPRNWKYMKG